MKRFYEFLKLLLFVFLAAFLTGCVIPRKRSALEVAAQPLALTALLPVETEASYGDAKPSRDSVVQLGNAVLDTLAKAKHGNLIGPSKVMSLLGSNGIPACLCWKARDISVESNAIAPSRQVAQLLGVHQLVRCWLSPPICSSRNQQFNEGFSSEWSGYIKVDMELINLEPPKVLNTSSAAGRAEQTIGLWLPLLPFFYGATFGRAVDQAERTALTQLFEREHPEHSRP